MDILYESSKSIETHSGVFILWLTSTQVPVAEHIDRICNVLDIQTADRRKYKGDYYNFVSKQPRNCYIKFALKLVTETNSVPLNVSDPNSPRLNRSHKVLSFEDVETWDTNGEVQTFPQIMEHFNLKFLTAVNTTSTAAPQSPIGGRSLLI